MATRTRRAPEDGARVADAWQDGVGATLAGSNAPLRFMAELGTAFFGRSVLDQEQVPEAVERIAESTGEVMRAQVALAGEWLRVPLWVQGAASPADLQAGYVRLVEANRALAGAYLDAGLAWQRAALGTVERATETVRRAADTQTEIVHRVADDVREVQTAALEAGRGAADAARETAERVVQEAHAVAEQATERAEREREELERERRKAERARERERAEQERAREEERAEQERERRRAERARERERAEQERVALATRAIKGNVNREGEKIYHLPAQAGYDRVEAEQVFATEDEAQAAGFRRSQAPGGGMIKANVNRAGEKIYHLPGQANYDRVEAEMLFETEEQAQANGFRPSQR